MCTLPSLLLWAHSQFTLNSQNIIELSIVFQVFTVTVLDSHRKKWIYLLLPDFFLIWWKCKKQQEDWRVRPVLQDGFWLVSEEWFCPLIGHLPHHPCPVFRSYIAELWARLIMINLILPKQVAFKLMTQNFYWTWLAGICAKIKLLNFEDI